MSANPMSAQIGELVALIAEDEPLLAASLQRELHQLWPELRTELASNGLQATAKALQLLPDVLLFDVRMPGCSGLEAAQDIADQWPADRALPLLAFITAYDQYAVQAFEHAAIDYIVKPVQTARLQQTLDRIRPLAQQRRSLAAIGSIADHAFIASDEALLENLRKLTASHARPLTPAQPLLARIQASVGNQIVFIPIEEVIYFEAADKYVRVLTTSRELLIRTPIKDLLPQLDPEEFWQIHRSTLVRASLIETVHRDAAGRLMLSLHGRSEKLVVSRLYASLFKAM
jgi:DNA-binding LytR/AlgR family response regulator